MLIVVIENQINLEINSLDDVFVNIGLDENVIFAQPEEKNLDYIQIPNNPPNTGFYNIFQDFLREIF